MKKIDKYTDKKRFLLAFAVIFSWIGSAIGQEKFYFANGSSFSYRIVEADDKNIKYNEMKGDHGVKRAIGRENIVVIFNAKGRYLMVSDLETDPEKSRHQLETFYNSAGSRYDLLIKSTPLKIIPSTISFESDEVVNFKNTDEQGSSINKNALVAIIYRDGRHTLLVDATQAQSILAAAADKIDKQIQDERKHQKVETVKNEAAKTEPIKTEQVKQITPASTSTVPTLSESEYVEYRQKAIGKVDEFADYLNVITDQRLSNNDREKAIQQALKLFMPDATIEVSSNNRKTINSYTIETYLRRLKILPYGNVKIGWNEVHYVNELKQADDGNYYGTIVGTQTFTATGERGQKAYSDVTKKQVKVKLESYQKQIEGQDQLRWQILLGKIGVVTEE